MTPIPTRPTLPCAAGLVFWLSAIGVWVAFIYYEARRHHDPLVMLAMWLPMVMGAMWITLALYWLFCARRDLRRGDPRPSKIVLVISWTAGIASILFLVILLILG